MKKINILQIVESIKTLLQLKGSVVKYSDVDEEIIIEGFLSGYNISIILKNDKKEYVERIIMAQELRHKAIPVTEIAQIMGLSVSTIYRYLHIEVKDVIKKLNETKKS